MSLFSRWCLAVTAVIALIGVIGCGQANKVEDFTPATNNARTALTAALEHWKAGKPLGTIPDTKPTVEVVDSQWRGGQKLKSYEIISEAPPPQGQGPRTFTVRLTLAQGAPIETQYMVVGIEPLWVYRKEDFAKLSGG